MKRKILKIVIITFAVLIAFVAIAWYPVFSFLFFGEFFPSWGHADNSRTLPENFTSQAHQNGFAKDGLLYVKTIEATHPIFVIEGLLSNDYETVRNEFLEYVLNDISKEDFIWALQKYNVILQDSHMSSFGSLFEFTENVDEQTRNKSIGNIFKMINHMGLGNIHQILLSGYLDIS